MLSDQDKGLDFKTIAIGVAGLAIVALAFFLYAQNFGFLKKSPSTTATSTPAGDYSAIGNSTSTTKMVQVVGTANVPTGATSTKNQTTPAAPAIVTLPFKAPPFIGTEWNYDWGAAYLTDGTLSFGAATTTSGGDLFLASSSNWTNYNAQASVDWLSGASFGIAARVSDLKNFVYCDFSDGSAQIVLRTNGNDATVAQSATVNRGAGTVQALGIDVYGSDVACTVGGAEVLGATISNNEPAAGGIGLISWDKTPGASRISISSLQASPLANDMITVPFPAPVSAPAATTTATSTGSTEGAVAAISTTTSTTPVVKLAIPYSENNFANDINWQKTWGLMTVDSSGAMHVGNTNETSGGSAVLANTDNWINYHFSATVDWLSGQTFMAIARYVGPGDYVACNFVQDPNVPGSVTIELEKFVNGNEATLQTGVDANYSKEGNLNVAVSLSVQDAQAICSFNGHSISNTGSASYGVSPVAGGVGFSTWTPMPGASEIAVKKVSVTENY